MYKLFANCTCHRKLVSVIFSIYTVTLPGKSRQGKTCQGELASVYSRQFFLDEGTCQGKLASVNEALVSEWLKIGPVFFILAKNVSKKAQTYANVCPWFHSSNESTQSVTLTLKNGGFIGYVFHVVLQGLMGGNARRLCVTQIDILMTFSGALLLNFPGSPRANQRRRQKKIFQACFDLFGSTCVVWSWSSSAVKED